MNSDKKKILGIVTARGGSKSIPKKNIKELLGKPLLAYTVEAARDSGIFDRVIMSTDCPEIAAVAKELGLEVPFMRPGELAEDTTPTLPVLQHAVSHLHEKEGYLPDYIAILQPTSPLRQPSHFQEALQMLEEHDADSVVGVAEVPKHFNPDKGFKTTEKGHLEMHGGGPLYRSVVRRQDVSPMYYPTGAIYLFRTSLLHGDEPNFYGDKVVPYFTEEKYALDVDTLEDWEKAEQFLQEE